MAVADRDNASARWRGDVWTMTREAIGKSRSGNGNDAGTAEVLVLSAPEALVLSAPDVLPSSGTRRIHSRQHKMCTARKKMRHVVRCDNTATTSGAPTQTVMSRRGRSDQREGGPPAEGGMAERMSERASKCVKGLPRLAHLFFGVAGARRVRTQGFSFLTAK